MVAEDAIQICGRFVRGAVDKIDARVDAPARRAALTLVLWVVVMGLSAPNRFNEVRLAQGRSRV